MFVGNIFDGATTGIDVGDIGHSLRFAASRSCYLSRTPGSAGDRQKFTLSTWVKLGSISGSVGARLFSNSGAAYVFFYVSNNGILTIAEWNGASNDYRLDTSALLRDFSSWYHIVIAFDTTQATASNRIKIYINGVQVTSFSTANYPAQNFNSQFNNTNTQYIGRDNSASYADEYLARTCFVSGSQLDASSFGYLNTTINEWVSKSQSAVKAVVDAGGTNSFMLDFDNGSSLTTLGYDKSAKGNNWTLSGHSLTAGTSYDWMLDVPGNSYATLNAVQKKSGDTLSNGNLTQSIASTTSAAPCATPATIFLNSGKWYAECTATTLPSTGFGGIGLIRATGLGTAASFPGNSGSTGLSWAIDNGGNTYAYENGSSTSKGAGSLSAGNVMQVAVDFDNQKFWIGINNSWLNSGNPSAGTSPFSTAISAGEFYAFALSTWNGGSWVFDWNFGQRPFAYTPPTGFKALCQANMPDVPAAYLNPRKHADVLTWTGDGSNPRTLSGLNFSADMIWHKSRSTASMSSNAIQDVVRGFNANNNLYTNLTASESDYPNRGVVNSVSSTGFTFNQNASDYSTADGLNENSQTFVAWLLKAGGAGVSNTAGSITSTVSANQDIGFSMGVYDATGANGTIGHGCKVNGVATAPGLIIIKNRFAGTSWVVWHSGIANTEVLLLNSTNAKTTDTTAWNSTSPTSTVFSVGTGASADTNQTNASANDHFFMAFAPGFFSIGSYTGNGSADGPYVHTGHKSRWLLVKQSSGAGGNWVMWDTARDTKNAVQNDLYPNLSDAEPAANDDIDMLATGFKPRRAGSNFNASGETYIYISIPDVFAKYALAR